VDSFGFVIKSAVRRRSAEMSAAAVPRVTARGMTATVCTACPQGYTSPMGSIDASACGKWESIRA
jgi:hypothetical protein